MRRTLKVERPGQGPRGIGEQCDDALPANNTANRLLVDLQREMPGSCGRRSLAQHEI